MTIDVFDSTIAWSRLRNNPILFIDETDSTNTLAKNDETEIRPRLALPGSSYVGPSIYLARTQNRGRGRGSHTWSNPQHGALLSSWSFAVRRLPQPFFSAAAGLALYQAATRTWPEVPFSIKAPNDLFIGRKKTAGILIESVEQGADKRTVVGIGMNFLAAPAGLDLATCLKEHLPSGPSGQLDDQNFELFLDTLCFELRNAVIVGQSDALGAKEKDGLLTALNRYPFYQAELGESLVSVDDLGQLHSANKYVRWQDL